MAQQYGAANFKTKTSLLVFTKGSTAPIVLYFEEPQKIYENLKNIINSTNAPKVIELDANGPIKKVCLTTGDINGIALQEEQHLAH